MRLPNCGFGLVWGGFGLVLRLFFCSLLSRLHFEVVSLCYSSFFGKKNGNRKWLKIKGLHTLLKKLIAKKNGINKA